MTFEICFKWFYRMDLYIKHASTLLKWLFKVLGKYKVIKAMEGDVKEEEM